MTDTANNTRMEEPPAEPGPALKRLNRLVGTWALSGDVGGTVNYEWMEGGFFLIQHVNLEQADGQRTTGLEVIGHLHAYDQPPSPEIWSRYYSGNGQTFDYVYELKEDTLTIWFGGPESPAYYRGTFSDDGTTLNGAWHYPGGGGYTSNATRIT